MLILKINNKKNPEVLDDTTRSQLEEHGLTIEDLDPSSMSFLTSMRIATACKKNTPDIVLTYTMSDALGAISACELTQKRGKNFKKAFRVTSRTVIPHSIPKAIKNGIDIWIFDSCKTLNAWKVLLEFRQTCIIGQAGAMFHVEHTTNKDTDNLPVELTFIGELGKAENLAKIVNAMANLEPDQRPGIRVSGTGKARYVMPIVKRARLMDLNITWLGENFNIDTEIARADGFILSDNPYSSAEIQAMSAGVPPVDASNLSEWINPDIRIGMTKKAVENYASNHAPAAVASHFKNLLK